MVVGLTGFVLNGLDLRTLAMNISSPNGWDVFPGLKSSGVQFAYTHGEDLDGRRFYKPRDIDLDMVILATNAAGVVTTSPQQHVDENIATLLGALHNSHGPISLVRTLASGATRTATVRPLDFAQVDQSVGLSRACQLTLRMGYPFWHGAAFNVVRGGAGAFVFNNLGNAPINDMVITFTAAGRLTHDDTGDYLESDVAGAIVNVHTGEVSGANPGDIHGNRPWWIQLEPGNNNLTATAALEIDGAYSYF